MTFFQNEESLRVKPKQFKKKETLTSYWLFSCFACICCCTPIGGLAIYKLYRVSLKASRWNPQVLWSNFMVSIKAEKSCLQYRKLLNFLKTYVYIENLITINIKNKSNKKTTLKAARSNDVVKATFKKCYRIITILSLNSFFIEYL